ncbi:phage head closure protein [Solibacillus sp. FSL R7-0668]|uniref:phage head closure protein n=1 Tax=Solibacillus sp. FSL R7-0668 TaxID=2921688 RepID=UPI0030F6E64E
MYDEFPHEVTLKVLKNVPNGSGGVTKKWVPERNVDCFVDTPSTNRLVEASKLGITIHRDLYCEYGEEIPTTVRIEYEGIDYVMSGDTEDQGGMHEVLRIPLKKVT